MIKNSEKEKMIAGYLYHSDDKEICRLRDKAHVLCFEYNNLCPTDEVEKQRIIDKLIINKGENVYLQGPIQFDYGCNTTIGERFFANYNLTIIDVCPVKIGKNVLMGPNVTIVTALHPLYYEDRTIVIKKDGFDDVEYGKPVTIEDNCWIASNVTVLPGVTIGEGSVIGAGSVVCKSIPAFSLAFGNPCKVIRKITEKDSLKHHPELFISGKDDRK